MEVSYNGLVAVMYYTSPVYTCIPQWSIQNLLWCIVQHHIWHKMYVRHEAIWYASSIIGKQLGMLTHSVHLVLLSWGVVAGTGCGKSSGDCSNDKLKENLLVSSSGTAGFPTGQSFWQVKGIGDRDNVGDWLHTWEFVDLSWLELLPAASDDDASCIGRFRTCTSLASSDRILDCDCIAVDSYTMGERDRWSVNKLNNKLTTSLVR